MPFRATSLAATALFAALSVTLLVVPGLIFWLFGLDANPAAEVMARRAGILFIALGLVAYGLRDLPAGETRRSVAMAFAAMMSALALLGTVEFALGRVGPGIFIAVLGELAFAGLFLSALRK